MVLQCHYTGKSITICIKKWASVPETKLFKCCQNSVDHFSNKLFSSLFSQEKKWAKDIIILEEFALCTKFHEFDDERETFMNCTFVRVLKIMILFLPKLDLFS